MSLDLRKPVVLDGAGNAVEFDQTTQVLIGGGFVPMFVDQGETFVVPEKRQAVATVVPDVDGVMQIDGLLEDLSVAH